MAFHALDPDVAIGRPDRDSSAEAAIGRARGFPQMTRGDVDGALLPSAGIARRSALRSPSSSRRPSAKAPAPHHADARLRLVRPHPEGESASGGRVGAGVHRMSEKIIFIATEFLKMLPIELHNCRIGYFLGLPRGLLGGSGTTGCGRNTDERSSDCE